MFGSTQSILLLLASAAEQLCRDSAGGLVMSASHNPGGPDEDWGIKFNYRSGEPAPERITDAIFGFTQSISEICQADTPDTDLAVVGTSQYGNFEACAQPLLPCALCSCYPALTKSSRKLFRQTPQPQLER